MPIYEYKCADCGAEFEALVLRDAQPDCPECQSKSVSKRMSAPAAAKSEADGCDGACGAAPKSHACGCGGCCCHH
ncbi:MAG: zinc ribbon domain-containing protein [Thermoguttaceae bacterium]|nr:zinc ribbon domain-containing protein [Thermoguttaceae bacterium]